MTLMTPLALGLLLALPLLAYIGWPRNRFRRVRDASSLIVRLLIAALLVLALAGLQVTRSADRLAVVFLVDVSDSMGAQAQEMAFDYVRDALAAMPPDDTAALVVFGGDAQVARSMSGARELGPIRAMPNPGDTDIAAAIRLGLALFPGDTARRLVILSDGLPTRGDALAAAQIAAAANVEISYVPVERPYTPEVLVRAVDVPPMVDEDQLFDLRVTIGSEEATRSIVTVLAAGDIVHREEVELRPGDNNFTLRLRSGAAGFRDFLVRVDPLGEDGFFQNNAMAAFTQVRGAPRVLIVAQDVDGPDARYLPAALAEVGLQTDVITPARLPQSMAGLAQYDSVVLANIPAASLSQRRMETLRTYVSDLGGGLVVVGGPNAFGPGGYYRTPLEDALPVEMQIVDQQRLPQLTIAYLIDRSGSMGMTTPSGIPFIDLAKEAIIRSIDLLQPTDRAGVASFDMNAYWIAEFQDVQDRQSLQRLVATLHPSGGTSIMAGMQLVAQDIVAEPSPLRHVILLTDGGAIPDGLVTLTGNLYQNAGVTTSVISIGPWEPSFLRDMAEAGGGYFHGVPDAHMIPNIFSAETVLATRSYILEETFNPILTANHPIMSGIPALPALRGYVATTPRAAAQTILRGPEPYRDPVLAAWQYGLGRSVAFTSDATARWGQSWVSWDDFATFWGQAVRWTITEGATGNLETRVQLDDGQARVIVDARDDSGGFLNGLDLVASVVQDPTRGGERVQLRQVAPGRYEGAFRPGDEGAYFLRVAAQSGDGDPDAQFSQTTGWVHTYSAEYATFGSDTRLLESLADLTGGADLSERPAAAFAHTVTGQRAHVPLWPWLLLAALLLLPLDIAVRRLLVTRGDLRRLLEAIRGPVTPQPDMALRLAALRAARDRARGQPEVVAQAAPTAPGESIRSLRASQRQRRAVTGEGSPATVPDEAAPTPRYRPPESAPPHPGESKKPEEPASLGARLLKKRRQDDENPS